MKLEQATQRLIKDTATLSRTSGSKERGLFLAEGVKVVNELLASQVETAYLLVRNDMISSLPERITAPVYSCGSSDFDKISTLKTPSGILAVGRRPALTDLLLGPDDQWTLAVDGISDPGNMGTILRTAEWFGVRKVVCSPGSVDCFSPKVVQSAMGSLFRLKVYYAQLPDFLRQVNKSMPVLAATLTGTGLKDLDNIDRGVLVIGSESHGVSAPVLECVTRSVTIGKAPHAATESLNAAVACGILLQHFCGKK